MSSPSNPNHGLDQIIQEEHLSFQSWKQSNDDLREVKGAADIHSSQKSSPTFTIFLKDSTSKIKKEEIHGFDSSTYLFLGFSTDPYSSSFSHPMCENIKAQRGGVGGWGRGR
jgi:hypothetical protein